jgi:hypothetical protein
MFTEKTYEILKKSVLTSMAIDGRDEPFKCASTGDPTDIVSEVRKSFNIFSGKLRILDASEMKCLKKSKILMYKTAFYFNLAPSTLRRLKQERNVPVDEWLYSYCVLGETVNGVPTECRVKSEVSLGRVYGDFKDDFGDIKFPFKDKHYSYDAWVAAIQEYISSLGHTWYLYTTNCHIPKHYRMFENLRNVSSCMSRTNDAYQHPRPNADKYTGDAKWIHPLETYENSPNLRLGLITKIHHSEWEDDEYPFDIRTILLFDREMKPYGGNHNYYGRVYDGVSEEIKAMGFNNSLTGGVLNAIYSNEGVLVLPYVDNNLEYRNQVIWSDRLESSSSINSSETLINTVIPEGIATQTDKLLVCGDTEKLGVLSRCILCVEPTEDYGVGRPYRPSCSLKEAYRHKGGIIPDAQENDHRVYVETRQEYYDEEDVVWCESRQEYLHVDDAVPDYYEQEYFYEDDEDCTWQRCCYYNEAFDKSCCHFSEYENDFISDLAVDNGYVLYDELEVDYYLESNEAEYHEAHQHVRATDSYGCESWYLEEDTVYSSYLEKCLYTDEAIQTPDGEDYIFESDLEDWASYKRWAIAQEDDEYHPMDELYYDKAKDCFYLNKPEEDAA